MKKYTKDELKKMSFLELAKLFKDPETDKKLIGTIIGDLVWKANEENGLKELFKDLW